MKEVNLLKIKRWDKKGAELESSNIVIWVVSLVVLGVLLFFIFQGKGFAENIGQNIPGKVEIVTQACNLVSNPNSVDSYCNQIREIGKNKYVTCDYGVTNEGFKFENSAQAPIPCNPDTQTQRIKSQITEMKLGESVQINGKPVSVWNPKVPAA